MYRALTELDGVAAIDAQALADDARAAERRMAASHPGYSVEMPFFPPAFAWARDEGAFAGYVEALLGLFSSLPGRLAAARGFGALLERLRYSPAQAEMLLPYLEPRWLGAGLDLARFDVFATDEGFKAVELNATGGIGGIGVLEDYIAAFETSLVAQRLRAAGLDWRMERPTEAFRRLIVDRVREGREPPDLGAPARVAMASLPDDLDQPHSASSARYLGSSELEVVAASIHNLEVRRGLVHFAGERVHAVWAGVSFEAMFHDVRLWAKTQELLEVAADGGVLYLVPPSASVFGNKALFALITSERDDALFTAAERGLIDRAIPRTLLVSADTAPEIARRQSELVLKPARGVGGFGVLFGPKLTANAWGQALKKIVASGMPFIAQRLCAASHVATPAAAFGAAPTTIELVLGGIGVGGRFAGNLLRGQPTGTFRPINCHAGGRFAASCVIPD